MPNETITAKATPPIKPKSDGTLPMVSRAVQSITLFLLFKEQYDGNVSSA
ncbi:hypothetical protein [Dictyobacter arantiisoli]|uniref:Uncharacterized protein n=1 Tax=Dictyobacter arantiisoli TaxID=2014874 RepID=A0A5A5T6S1_9CHLR|nr:hypothetical protein [Dictyobacter arantiisoli]GCF07068.1 hypothetical protein KDI_06320 [Dictyobacter arantiisoli]